MKRPRKEEQQPVRPLSEHEAYRLLKYFRRVQREFIHLSPKCAYIPDGGKAEPA